MAVVHAGLGDVDAAIEWLERACAERDVWLVWLKVDPRLDRLRADARFEDLLRRVFRNSVAPATESQDEVGEMCDWI
jgi:hypothetical protein